MRTPLRIPLFIAWGILCSLPGYSQFGRNSRPAIIGQKPLSTYQATPITLQLTDFTVIDLDDPYPEGFTLRVFSGKNYSVSGTTVTPAPNFTGTLKVEVTVHDGKDESRKFEAKISVVSRPNTPPVITGQVPLSTQEETAITIEFADLIVEDPDNEYPAGFSMKISSGPNYTVSGSGTRITPARGFTGELSAPITVNDGRDNSAPYDLKITVTPENVAPVITGQSSLSTEEATAITILLAHLSVTDPDNKYPDDFTLQVLSGSNYSFSGNTVTPANGFTGTLNVNVRVNDGKANSPTFSLKIQVTSSNVPPVITGQVPLSISETTPITILLTHLSVTDPDNKYPDDFTLQVLSGSNYSFSGNTVTPAKGFTGTLNVNVRVNDGKVNSPTFSLKIQVTPSNVPPVITGQVPLSISEDTQITILLTHLSVTDPDNKYPDDFTLTVLPGENYTVSKNAVTPVQDFNGILRVNVAVSDGKAFSEPFSMIIMVTPVNDPPRILNLEATALKYDRGIGPIYISNEITIIDVDDDSLTIAEIGFRALNYQVGNDILVLNNDSTALHSLFDAQRGILFLIGKASVKDFENAFRSVQYNYITSEAPFREETKTIYMHVSDGKSQSEIREREIEMVPQITLHIPNAFTPNGDQANDRWIVRPLNSPEIFSDAVIRVYNASGRLVYEATGLENEWNGEFMGEVLPSDTYYYTIDLNLSYSKATYRGSVTILR